MERGSKKLLSTLLALAMVFSLFAAMPLTANAEAAGLLAGTIFNYDPGNSGPAVGQLTAIANSATQVTVKGKVSGATNSLQLDIDPGVTVIWTAELTGTVSGGNGLIELIGSGKFEVATGGSITNNGTDDTVYANAAGFNITVSGGTVKAAGGGVAIRANAPAPATVTMNNGTVSASGGGRAIYATNAAVTVIGGTVEATGSGNTIVTDGGPMSTVTIGGGTVKNSGSGNAIDSTGKVDVSGGTVCATKGFAVKSSGGLTAIGGFIFAYGTDIIGAGNVIDLGGGSPTVGGTAVICAWTKAAGNIKYNEGANEDLTAIPTIAAVSWGVSDEESGIKYVNGANTGFFPLGDVTVTPKEYTVTFNSNGGNAVPNKTVNSGSKLAKPADPVKEGFVFAGWFTDAALTAEYDFDKIVTASFTLYAKWTEKATPTITPTPTPTTTTTLTPTPADQPKSIKLKIGDPYMYVNGMKQEIDPGRGTVPLISNSRTLLPIRAVVEAMGGTVGWDAATRMITLNANGHTVTMWLDKLNLIVDGKNLTMDVAPVSINDRTMVPIRFAAENLGCEVEWKDATKEVTVLYK